MRPTAKMSSQPLLVEHGKESVDARKRALRPDIAFLAERRRQAVRALEQTRQEIGEGSAKKAVIEALRETELSVAGKPAPGAPGVITARIVGLPGQREPAVPLRGLLLRLKVRDKVVAESHTDLMGTGAVTLPKEAAGPYVLEAISPVGDRISMQTGSAKPEESPVHLFELAMTGALAPLFERAEPWRAGLVEAGRRRDLAVKAVEAALARQEKQLVELVAELDKALS